MTVKTVTDEQREAIHALIRNDSAFMSTFFQIPSKENEGSRKPFRLWDAQERLINNLTGRDLVIKPAQIGITSACTGLFFKRTLTTPDTTSIIIAHEETLTKRLLNRADVFYKSSVFSDPESPFFLKMDHDSASEKRFPSINSVMYIGTARAQVFGRGEPIHNLLLSEAAFYIDDARDRIVLPSLQRVPPSGSVIMESTPNGEGGYYFDEVQKALDGHGTFTLHVFYWWDNPDNFLPRGSNIGRMPEQDKWELDYTLEESNLVRHYGVTEDQIRWRRWKIREMDVMFWQEHLESLDTCFLIAGSPYYDPQRTIELSKGCYPPPFTTPGGGVAWYKPDANGIYVMGVDPGQGKVTESVATVWRVDLEEIRQEARLSGLIEGDILATKTMELGKYYNNALIVAEVNAHGILLVKGLKKYPRVYMRRDVISGYPSLHPGWITSARTKPFMMAELQRRLRNLLTHDSELVRQIRGWREVGGLNRPVTITADDYHDSACLAMIGAMNQGPRPNGGFKGPTGWNW